MQMGNDKITERPRCLSKNVANNIEDYTKEELQDGGCYGRTWLPRS